MFESSNKEEEYTLPDQDEYSSADELHQSAGDSLDVDTESYASTEPGGEGIITQKEPKAPFVLNKRIIAAIVLAIVAVVVFSYMRRTTEKVVPVVSHKKPRAMVVKSQPKTRSNAQVNAQINEKFGSLGSQIQSNSNAIDRLSDKVQQVGVTLSSVSAKQLEITPLISDVQTQLQKMVSQQKKKAVKVAKVKKMQAETYTIKAMVPGRAWLVSAFGKTASVGKNEYLEGYGRILKVDDNDGVVYTSSGRTIYYGKNDY